MEAHLISSDTSDNESPTNKEKTAMAPLATDVTMDTINSNQSKTILPSTSAQALANESPENPELPINEFLSSTLMTKKKKKKGFLLALNRMNTILLHIIVPLILLVCKYCDF